MARQSFLWTTLPNGLTEDGRGLRVSVLLSPRLDPAPDPTELSSFPEWLDWPATLAQASFEVSYGGTAVSVPTTQTTSPDRVDTSLGTADSEVWVALFPPDLGVWGFAYQDLANNKVLSYDSAEVAALVQELYGSLAGAAEGGLPTVSDYLDDPAWSAVVRTVDALDWAFIDRETGLRDPGQHFEAFRRGRVDDVDFERRGGGTIPSRLWRALASMQLFHTPPSTPIRSTRSRRDDPRIEATTLEYAQTDLPTEADLAEGLDFHQVVAAMNSYPTLLRRLGIVVDLVLDRDAFAAAPDAPLSVAVTFPAGTLATPRTPDAALVTHAALSDADFTAVPNPVSGPGGFQVSDRLLDLDPNRFALLQVDVDGAGLKLLNFARSLGRLEPGDQRVDPVTRHEKQLGAPALRTAGMMLVQRQRARMLEAKFADNATKNKRAEQVFSGRAGALPPQLWAEDLLRGFRYDIWDAATGIWRSLCRREATYELNSGVVVTPAAGEEEGTVRLGATKSPDPASNQDLVWLHEALVSWTGWSLAAPPPGRAIKPDDTVDTTEARTEAVLPPGIDFRSRFSAVRGSLPRLRYGRSYWVRARAVDLAGNSLSPRDDDFGLEDPASRAQPFLRYEPVAAPVLALVKRDDGTTEWLAEGESMHHMAIRSFNDVAAENSIPTLQVARRFAVPAQSSIKEAELHGMLDQGGRVQAATFDLLVEKDRDATDPAAALVQETLPAEGSLVGESATVFAVYRDGHPLTYLPDPLAEEVAVRFFGHPRIDNTVVMTIPLYPSGAWPAAVPFLVEAFEQPGAPPSYDPATRTLRVPVDKADRVTIRLSMRLSTKTLHDVMGVWRWVTSPPPALETLATDGQHWMLTPWQTVEVVHAVQRPLIAPKILRLSVERGYRATSAELRFVATCSLASTDRVDVRAEWHEPSDDAAAGNVDQARGDTAFSVKITTSAGYAQRLLGHERGGAAEHAVVGDDLIEIGASSDYEAPKHHEFHDTRYRRVEYWLEATSRFREFLPRAMVTEVVGGIPTPTEKNITVVGPRTVSWVPNSAAPPVPEVLYVVPTFGWTRSQEPAGNASSWRRGGGLRVYLDHPWNECGYGEMLGVVLPPASFTGDPDTIPPLHPYRTLVTQWGNDPIWGSPYVPGPAPRRANFPLARTGPDPTGSWLPPDAPVEERDQPPEPFQVTGLGAFNAPVEVAPHDVFYDHERQLWFCDIEIDQRSSYWPFVRLALARYQPVSRPGAHLSEVVLADFMPLVADRWLNVKRTDQPRTRSVTVFGFTYDDSSGHQEASQAPSMSLIDAVNNRVVELSPASVAQTSVIEVWVEQLDPARGEDFGWERLPGVVIEPASTAESATSRFIPGPQIARARALHQERRFEALVSENLVDMFTQYLVLWDGTVTLPADDSSAGHLRLVIAEYEEYLVDDDHPYDQVPTRKGRRLVFVEHVNLP